MCWDWFSIYLLRDIWCLSPLTLEILQCPLLEEFFGLGHFLVKWKSFFVEDRSVVGLEGSNEVSDVLVVSLTRDV